MKSQALLSLTCVICLPVRVFGFIGPGTDYIYEHKGTTDPIIVDGILAEDIWSKLPLADGFWMSYPVDDRRVEKNLRTEVNVTYDKQFLYIGAVCYGTDHYVIKTLKRDTEFSDGDGFGVVIDPVNEKSNGFTFGKSPAGVQTKYLVTGQTGRRTDPEPGRSRRGINMAWDNRWFCEVTNHPDRWIVEIAIPFKTLRFDKAKDQWGINFFRRDARSNSILTWAPVPIEFNEDDLGYTGVLIWNEPPEKARNNLALIPYVRGATKKDYEAGT